MGLAASWLLTALAAVVAGAVGVGGSPASAAPGDPFDPADAFVFVAQNNPTQLFKAIPDGDGNVVFQAEGAPRAHGYNALAYNPADNYLYAIKTGTGGGIPAGSLIRIGQGGVATRVGSGTLTPAVVGAIADDGFFYSFSGTQVQRTDPATGVVAGSYTLPSAPSIVDVTYASGYFWSVDASGAALRIDLTATPPTVTSTAGVAPAGNYGAMWTYGNGNIGLSNNATGRVRQYAISDPAGTPTFTLVSEIAGPSSGNNDGAASPGMPTDLELAKTSAEHFTPGGTLTYTLTVTNNGPGNSSGYVVSDTVPALFTDVQTTTPGCSVDGNTVTCIGARTLAGESKAITITAAAPAHAPVCVTNSATITANELDPDASNDTGTAETCAEPGLSITKAASTSLVAEAGDTVQYSFLVVNTGGYEITNIAVDDPIVDPVVCAATTLAPGATTTCSGSYTVDQDDLDHGSVDNIASVSGDGPDGPLPPTPSNGVTVPAAENPQLRVDKTADTEIMPAAPGTITYSFEVSNVGNQTVSDIEVTDPLTPAVSCPATELAPGASMTCTGIHEVAQTEFDAGTLTNQAVVTGNDPHGDPLTPTPSNQVTINAVQDPELTVVKTTPTVEMPDTAGDGIDYRVTVTNTGNVTIDDIVVDDPLIADLACDDDTLAPGARTTCYGTYTVTADDIADGTITNTATATGTPPPGAPALPPTPSNTVEVPLEQNPQLSIVKSTSTTAVAAVGDIVDYTFTITNIGNVPVSDVTVVDPGLTQLVCAVVPLQPGGFIGCSGLHEVTQADLDAGEVLNTATVTGTWDGDPIDPGVSDEVRVPVTQNAEMTVEKSADPASVDTIGQPIAYTFRVTNTGNVTLTDVSIDDPLIGQVDCPSTALAPGESLDCTGTRAAAAADFDDGTIVNVATGTATPPPGLPQLPPVPSNTVTVTAEQSPELSVTKVADTQTVSAVGDTIGYTFVITNSGNVTVEGISLSDPQVSDLDCGGVTTLSADESVECTATYSVTAADLDAGSITNIASVTGQGPDGPLTPVFSDEVVVEVDQQPSLSIVKSVDTTVVSAAGTELRYTFEVSNTGNVTVDGITIDDPLVGDVDCGGVASLAIGESVECTATYVVTVADLDAGSITNVASVTGLDPGGDPLTPVPSDEVVVEVDQQPSLSIVKSTAAAPTAAGDTVRFDFEVTNTGNVTITGIVVDDPMLASVTCPDDTLAPGAAMECAGDYTVTAADIAAGQIVNTATVSGEVPGGPTVPAVPSNEVVVSLPPPPPTVPPTTTPPPTTPVTPPTTTPVTPPDPGELPATGGDSAQLLRLVALTLAAGGALLAASRRRRPASGR